MRKKRESNIVSVRSPSGPTPTETPSPSVTAVPGGQCREWNPGWAMFKALHVNTM